MRTRWLAVAALGAAVTFGCAGDGEQGLGEKVVEAVRPGVSADALKAELSAALSGAPPEGVPDGQWTALRERYASRDHQPLWVDGRGASSEGERLLAALCDADAEGLNAEDYPVAELRQALREAEDRDDAASLIAAELRLSRTYLTYGLHLATGRVPPRQVGWNTAHRALQPSDVLAALGAQAPSLEAALEVLRPPHPQYAKLKEKLAELRALDDEGGWPGVPEGRGVEPGDRSPLVPAIRARLWATGELERSTPADAQLYDEQVVEAVKRFQAAHLLEPDGRIGKATLRELRATVADRIMQVEANLERWRFLPADLGERHLLVNLPTFDVQGFERGERTLRMKAIVGLPDWETPVFSTAMDGVNFHPQWSVPDKILAEEIVPKLREDPEFAAKAGLRVIHREDNLEVDPLTVDWASIDPKAEGGLPYRFQQPPGDENPLGRIKVHMPNRYAIYLHDTPSEKLFATTHRAYSHGCVRVEAPEELSAFVLDGSEAWSRDEILSALDGSRSRYAEAAHPARVHLVYFTAWVEDDGRLVLAHDLYRWDRPLMKRLAPKPQPGAQHPGPACG